MYCVHLEDCRHAIVLEGGVSVDVPVFSLSFHASNVIGLVPAYKRIALTTLDTIDWSEVWSKYYTHVHVHEGYHSSA